MPSGELHDRQRHVVAVPSPSLPASSSPLSSTAFVRASLCLTVCVLREENRNKKDDEILYESNMWRGYVYKVKWVVHQNTVHVASYML